MDEPPKFPEKKTGMTGMMLASLIVLAIAISTIGTWAVINSMHTTASEPTESGGTNAAQVSINIQQPPLARSDSVGTVSLNIQKP